MVEKPWGMLSLFTHFWSLQVAFTGRRSFWKTMIRFQLFKWIDTARGCDTEMSVASLWIRSFFLRWITADPSMDETIVCRDPWGSLVFSRPVSDYEWIHPFRGCRWHRHTCMWRLCEAGRFSYGESPRTFPLRELHSTDDTIVWRDPEGSWACLRPVSDYEWIHPFRVCRWHRHTCMWHPFEAGHFSYGESPRTPPLEGTSLHRWHNSVERPWGILSLFTTCFWLQVNSPFQSL